MADDGDREDRRGTSSDKTLSVMDLFTPEKPEWTVEEACTRLGQSESTVYRYFRSLATAGLIFSIRPGRYLLGPGIIHYDRQLRMTDPLLRAAEPAFLEIAAAYDGPGSVFISRIYRDHIMTMHEHRLGSAPPFPEGTFARGRLAPLFCGAPSFAILAFLEVRAVRALFSKTNENGAEWLETKRHMRIVRARGYAVGIDDPDPGILYVSVPLKQQDGGIAGSLTLMLGSGPDNDAVIAKASALLVEAADAMARRALISAPR